MEIGIISDIHGHLSDAAEQALQGCDHILCAGDSERPSVLDHLENIAPTTAVLGNCDYYGDFAARNVPAVACPVLGGVRFKMVHRPADVGHVPEDVQVVVHGHTHIPRDEVIAGVRWINPGSATRPRGDSVRSVVRMRVEEGRVVDVRFVPIHRPLRS
ncbi:MAG: metallophosphoesterase family protein [Coriobacteriia bacterium]|nr:metallophosphoesterase family protein [Coriobacteriia bacterium]